ncbi:MAG TPA: GGDEF domain-containing protein [Woeseiaceae bacterium]|nr:GGDEF domain-containing protein [Woeseiaceae bacterium]
MPYLHGSRYGTELRKGAQDMRFPPDLEREYHMFYLAERRSHSRYFNVVMCGLSMVALAACILSARMHSDPLQHARVAAIALTYGTLAWAAHSRFYERVYLAAAAWGSTLIGLLGAVEIAHWIHAGVGELFGLLTAYSIGLYFLSGILYHAALRANAVMTFSFLVTLVMLDEPLTKAGYLTGILAGTGAITGIAFRHQGTRFRRSFLARGLISEMAARDGLTGLKNRRAFDEHLVRVWQQGLRDRRTMVVMLSDVDRFKDFNDHYGHQAGDDALQRVAEVVGNFAKRPLDLAARYGGEELAVILFDASRDMAATVAEQIRAAVRALDIEDQSSEGRLTISIGVAVVRPTLERSPEGAVQLADEALYAAKRDGRNRVVVLDREQHEISTGIFQSPKLHG